eukprot:208387-Chlamydomonas_euryale.AAC.2
MSSDGLEAWRRVLDGADDKTIPRWPQTSNPAIPHYASATMGCEWGEGRVEGGWVWTGCGFQLCRVRGCGGGARCVWVMSGGFAMSVSRV